MKKNKSFFWASYSDLMTSLFFVMLLLFVTTVTMMFLNGKATEEELAQIHELEEACNRLPGDIFEQDTINKRWKLRDQYMPQFEMADSIIPHKDEWKLLKVGMAIDKVLQQVDSMKNQPEYKNMDVKYLVVIEGMSSNLKYDKNDELSYKRALALYYLWKKNGINLENNTCQVQVSGSGIRGVRPYNTRFYKAMEDGDPNAASFYDINEEKRNQCIIIQIIPKFTTKRK